MSGLRSLLRSIGRSITKPVDDLVDVSLQFETLTSDNDAKGSLSSGSNTRSDGTSVAAEDVAGDLKRRDERQDSARAPSIDEKQLSSLDKNDVRDNLLNDSTRAPIIRAGASHEGTEALAASHINPVNLVDSNGSQYSNLGEYGAQDDPRQNFSAAAFQTATSAAMNARKAYETISVFGQSQPIIGDVYLSGQADESQFIRFEDCFGRRYRVPYERYRTWPQMQLLIGQACGRFPVLKPHIEQGRYHLTGLDGEIIMPEFWEFAVVPGKLIRMTLWPSPDPQTGAELTLPVGFQDARSAHFDERQFGSLPLYYQSRPSEPATGNFNSGGIVDGNSLATLRAEANAAFTNEDYRTAIVKFSEVINLDPTDHTLYLVRSRACMAIDSFDHALQDVVRAIELNEDFTAAWVQKGTVERALKDLPAAKAAFERALALNSTDFRAKKGLELVRDDLGNFRSIRHAFETPEDDADNTALFMQRNAQFEYMSSLGRGTFGSVDCVREVSTGSLYARKNIDATDRTEQERTIIKQMVRNEVHIMQKLRHHHIAAVLFYVEALIGPETWSIFMLPVAEYDLRHFLEVECIDAGYPRDPTKMLDSWFGCLISALAYAHQMSVKHEDIKPSNILIKGKKIYLSDFGTAKDFSGLSAADESDHLMQGTPVYWAPEPLPHGRPADVFSLGCVFAEILTVRQKRSLQAFRNFRCTPSTNNTYAYRHSLHAVRDWIVKELDIQKADYEAQIIMDQILSMLGEEPNYRPDARRVRRNLRSEETLSCSLCF